MRLCIVLYEIYLIFYGYVFVFLFFDVNRYSGIAYYVGIQCYVFFKCIFHMDIHL